MKIGIAPIGWTNDDIPELGGHISFEQCLSEMALAGYEGCEIGNKFPRNPNDLKRHLALRNLKICNQWFNFELTTKSLKTNLKQLHKHIKFLQKLDCGIAGGAEIGNSCHNILDIPVFSKRGRLETYEHWKDFNYKLNECGKLVRDHGMKLAYHHHMGTVVQTLEDICLFLDGTDPSLVFLNYDCGHCYFAGEDPVEVLKTTISRVAHVHLKDVRPIILKKVLEEKMSFLKAVKAGIFTVPGDEEGIIDFASIFDILNKSEYDGWLVVEAEQDPFLANPLEYAKKARSFIKENMGQ